MNAKIQTYFGFCIRARKIVYGVDNIDGAKKGIYLLIADGALGANSIKLMKKAQEKFACPFIITENGVLGELLHRPTVKAAAVQEKNLAEAIVALADKEPQFKFYSGGNN